MKYTKTWTVESQAAEDPWHSWLSIYALPSIEYQLVYWEDRVELEFFDLDRNNEFAQEFGL